MRRCLGCLELYKKELQVCPYCGYIEGTPADETVHIAPGSVLADRYLIGRVLGFGGFGVTYIAWDSKLEQKVAIKEYLPSEFSTRMPGKTSVTIFSGVKKDQFIDGLNKFVDEAKKLSKFQKEDGIVKIFDCIAENDTAYIIMEYLEGETLADRIKRNGIIPEKEAIEILMPVMKSLEMVHQEGIIHRDISPDNIFLAKSGAKLIDFGAARFATTSHSRSLTVIIKPGYSAEEQYRSKSDQGPHTDVYSLAATLYKMITGETPPDALERRAKLESARKDILVEPHQLNKNVSPVVENAVLNALNIQTDDRTATVELFIANLTADEPVKRVKGRIKGIDFYRIPLWIKILVPIVLIFLIVLGLTVDFESPFRRQIDVPAGYVTVPNVEGLDIESAISVLQGAGLTYVSGGNAVMDYVEADTIAYQSPEVGRTVPLGSSIELVVSKGSGDIILPANGLATVPAFLWGEEEDVVNDFTMAGLDPHITYVHNDNVQPGEIFAVVDLEGNELETGDNLEVGSWVVIQEATDQYYSEGLEYNCHADGTATLVGIGDCVDTDVVIPPLTPDGCVVDEIGGGGGIEAKLFREAGMETWERPFINGYPCRITSVVIPSTVTRICGGAFSDCALLETVTIMGDVTYIGDYSFEYCYSLSSINIPDSVTYIGTGAFSYCISLPSIDLPDRRIGIGVNAFVCCESLTEINGMRPSEWVSQYLYDDDVITSNGHGPWLEYYSSGDWSTNNAHYFRETPR